MSIHMGYPDQEVLIRALTTYISANITKSISIIRGMIRMSIEAICNQKNTTLKDAKALSENDRDAFFMDTMVYFFEKMNLDSKKRKKMKYDFLQIYERWKESKRVELQEIDPEKAKNLNSVEKSIESDLDVTAEESSDLINNLDSLDDFDLFDK